MNEVKCRLRIKPKGFNGRQPGVRQPGPKATQAETGSKMLGKGRSVKQTQLRQSANRDQERRAWADQETSKQIIIEEAHSLSGCFHTWSLSSFKANSDQLISIFCVYVNTPNELRPL